jgi:hypothetical protein
MMQGIIDLHHDIFFLLILIVSWILVRTLWHFLIAGWVRSLAERHSSDKGRMIKVGPYSNLLSTLGGDDPDDDERRKRNRREECFNDGSVVEAGIRLLSGLVLRLLERSDHPLARRNINSRVLARIIGGALHERVPQGGSWQRLVEVGTVTIEMARNNENSAFFRRVVALLEEELS